MTNLKFLLVVVALSVALGTFVEGQEVKDPKPVKDNPAPNKPAIARTDGAPKHEDPIVVKLATAARKDEDPILEKFATAARKDVNPAPEEKKKPTSARKDGEPKSEDPILKTVVEGDMHDSQRWITKRDSGDKETATAPRRRNKRKNAADREAGKEAAAVEDAGTTGGNARATPVKRGVNRNTVPGVAGVRSVDPDDDHHGKGSKYDPYLGTWPLSVERRVLGWFVVALLLLIAIMLIILVALIFRLRLCLECLCCKLKGRFRD